MYTCSIVQYAYCQLQGCPIICQSRCHCTIIPGHYTHLLPICLMLGYSVEIRFLHSTVSPTGSDGTWFHIIGLFILFLTTNVYVSGKSNIKVSKQKKTAFIVGKMTSKFWEERRRMCGKEKEIDSLRKNKEFILCKHTCIIEGYREQKKHYMNILQRWNILD